MPLFIKALPKWLGLVAAFGLYGLIFYGLIVADGATYLRTYALVFISSGVLLLVSQYYVCLPYWQQSKRAEFLLATLLLLGIGIAFRSWFLLEYTPVDRLFSTNSDAQRGFRDGLMESKPAFAHVLPQIVGILLNLGLTLGEGLIFTVLMLWYQRGRQPLPLFSKRLGQWIQPSKTARLVLGHLMGWIAYLFLSNLFDFFRKTFYLPMELLLLVPTVAAFYLCLRSSFRFLSQNRLIVAVVSALGIGVISAITKGILFGIAVKAGWPPYLDGINVLANQADFRTISVAKLTGYGMARTLSSEAYPILISFIYGYALQAVRDQQKLRRLSEERQREIQRQQQLENEVTAAKLQTLRYQINPHFLFNSLNFLYAQALPLSENLSRATLLLSEIMRYGLQESETKVPLEHEVRHLQNFVDFNQLRFANRLQVQFTVEGSPAFRRIMPLLLITFVENAFKYGELHDPGFPLQINLRVDSETLSFFVRNKKRQGPKEESTGIGLDNIRRRLELAYPSRYTLNLHDQPQAYTAELQIQL
ncbi:sensor histidine kinase [Siphonobacter sp.]|uniref:sensor histidine kinase n=1 Tax=Siphonobacter sp. TaxID=1869184 RepID=UPI003B3AF778